jgi:uncharacterized OsmC-like protein
MTQAEVRQYSVQANSTNIFGRVLCASRNHHFVVDGPAANGCPGEAITPAELFLSGIASCGVELVQVVAKRQDIPLETISVTVSGVIDRSNPVRSDVSLFNRIRLQFYLKGVTPEQGAELINTFKGG